MFFANNVGIAKKLSDLQLLLPRQSGGGVLPRRGVVLGGEINKYVFLDFFFAKQWLTCASSEEDTVVRSRARRGLLLLLLLLAAVEVAASVPVNLLLLLFT